MRKRQPDRKGDGAHSRARVCACVITLVRALSPSFVLSLEFSLLLALFFSLCPFSPLHSHSFPSSPMLSLSLREHICSVCVCIRAHINIYIHTHTHTYIRPYMYTDMKLLTTKKSTTHTLYAPTLPIPLSVRTPCVFRCYQ